MLRAITLGQCNGEIYKNVIIVSSENTKKIDMNLVYEEQHLSKYEKLKTRHYNINLGHNA